MDFHNNDSLIIKAIRTQLNISNQCPKISGLFIVDRFSHYIHFLLCGAYGDRCITELKEICHKFDWNIFTNDDGHLLGFKLTIKLIQRSFWLTIVERFPYIATIEKVFSSNHLMQFE